jgi:hypothetical protein
MYPIEYICTKEDTINTGINIDTVNVSNTNPQDTFSDSESIHLNNLRYTEILLIPTSKNANIANVVVNNTEVQVIKCDPLTPTFLPNKPEAIEASKGNNIIAKYII